MTDTPTAPSLLFLGDVPQLLPSCAGQVEG
jgi:hypothetical protein